MTAVLGCIADDFTGGTDLAETLSRNGMRTIQLLGVPDTALASEAAAQADALVVALKIRTVPVDEAVSQALAALEALRAAGQLDDRLYKQYRGIYEDFTEKMKDYHH